MKNLPFNIIITNGTSLTNNKSEYEINGVIYTVTSVFDDFEDKPQTISEKVFRIVDTQNAHLMAEENTDTINNEYTCLTAKRDNTLGEEETCSQ